MGRAQTVSGDFDGDGRADAVSLYDYAGTTSALWFFKSTGVKSSEPSMVFASSNWDAKRTKLIAGDFNGDGKDELMAFYSYGGTKTGVWLFARTAKGAFEPRLLFVSDQWNLDRTTLTAGRQNGKSVVVAVYDYGDSNISLWRF